MKELIDSYKPEFRAMLRLCLPIIVAQVGSVLMGVSNSVMIGKLGATSLAAAGVTNAIYVLFLVIGMGTLSAVAPMVATAAGAKDKEQCGILFRTSVEVAFLLTLVLTAALFIIAENFEVFGHPAEVTVIAKEYLRLLSFSTLPFMMFMAAKQFSDGLSYTKPAVYITIIGVSVNVLLNWLLIYGHFNLPKLGIVGSGIATMSARTIMAILMFGYIITNGNLRKYVPKLSENIKTLKCTIRVFKIGIPSGMQLFFEIGAFTAAAIIVGRIGVEESAAHQIGITLAAIATMLATGISVAGSIRVGNAVGEKDIVKVKKAGNAALVLAACSMLVTGTIFLGFTEQLVFLFNTTDKSLIKAAVSVLMIAGFFQISDGLQVVSLGILRGVSDVNIPTIFTLVAYWGIGLPVGYILGFYYGMGVKGIWIGLLIGLSTSALLLVTRFYRIIRVENRDVLFNNVEIGS